MESIERSWSELSPAERLGRRWDAFLNPGFPFAGPEAEAAYKARAARIKAAVLLEEPIDRVPVGVLAQFYPAYHSGLTPYEAMHDYEKAADAWHKCNVDLQPDMLMAPVFSAIPGRAFEIMDVKVLSWPGHGVAHDVGFQYEEREWMRADEYDLLIDDPTDYLLHVYLPRVAPGMQGFTQLVSPLDMVEIVGAPPYWMRWADPAVQASLEKLKAAGEESARWGGVMFPLIGRLLAEGFPGTFSHMSLAPFDFIGDTLRGTRGIITDMFRQPDAVLEACDRLARICVKWVTRRATPHSGPMVFIPLHKGADSFMSNEQFKTFYWPSLKKVILGLVEDGFVPYLFAEGGYNSRLEAIADVPVGKTLWHFDRTDMRRAKEVLGGTACIQGNVPVSLLHAGTADEVTEYCRDLISSVGSGGGFILDVGAVVDRAKQGNVLAMVNAAKQYGAY